MDNFVFIQTITYTCCLFFFDYCVPLFIIIFCYYHIVQTIFHHEKALRDQAKKMNVTSLRSNSDQKAQSAEMRVAKVALINIFLWVAMWTPCKFDLLQILFQMECNHIFFFSVFIPDAAIVLQGAVGDKDKITPLVTILPALFAKSASIANPIVYAISHPKYRLVFSPLISSEMLGNFL